jgi:hypothetical protein
MLSEELCEEHITAVVVGADVIPRLRCVECIAHIIMYAQ